MSAAPDDVGDTTPDGTVQWRVFAGVGTFIAVLAAIYWVASYEDAGTTMLVMASALALFIGTWLYLQDRSRLRATEHDAQDQRDEGAVPDRGATESRSDHPYLPDASLWPFAMGVGAVIGLDGFILGWPYATPGAALLVVAIVGFVAQARRRA